jgi:hypothetical protein
VVELPTSQTFILAQVLTADLVVVLPDSVSAQRQAVEQARPISVHLAVLAQSHQTIPAAAGEAVRRSEQMPLIRWRGQVEQAPLHRSITRQRLDRVAGEAGQLVEPPEAAELGAVGLAQPLVRSLRLERSILAPGVAAGGLLAELMVMAVLAVRES